MPKGTANAVVQIVKQAPGSTPKEIYRLLPDNVRPPRFENLSGQLSALFKAGQLEREPLVREGRRDTFRYTVNPSYKKWEHNKPKRKLRTPTTKGLEATVEELRARVCELRKWQEDAIARFPDLGVDPHVITARKIVADRLRKRGDPAGAKSAEEGRIDKSALVQAVVDALESAA